LAWIRPRSTARLRSLPAACGSGPSAGHRRGLLVEHDAEDVSGEDVGNDSVVLVVEAVLAAVDVLDNLRGGNGSRHSVVVADRVSGHGAGSCGVQGFQLGPRSAAGTSAL